MRLREITVNLTHMRVRCSPAIRIRATGARIRRGRRGRGTNGALVHIGTCTRTELAEPNQAVWPHMSGTRPPAAASISSVAPPPSLTACSVARESRTNLTSLGRSSPPALPRSRNNGARCWLGHGCARTRAPARESRTAMLSAEEACLLASKTVGAGGRVTRARGPARPGRDVIAGWGLAPLDLSRLSC